MSEDLQRRGGDVKPKSKGFRQSLVFLMVLTSGLSAVIMLGSVESQLRTLEGAYAGDATAPTKRGKLFQDNAEENAPITGINYFEKIENETQASEGDKVIVKSKDQDRRLVVNESESVADGSAVKKENNDVKKEAPDSDVVDWNKAHPRPEIKDFEHHEGVVIATKIHSTEHWDALEQSMCLLKHAYNNRVNYDILVFTSTEIPQKRIENLRKIVFPANLTIAIDIPGGLVGHVKSLDKARRDNVLWRCNASKPEDLDWRTYCHEGGKQTERLQYNWQAEFRSLHIWNHEALLPYKTMFWLDTDGFATEVWKKDPVATFLRNDLVILFDNFPAGSSRGDHFAERYKKAFNTTLCGIGLKHGHLTAKLGKSCTHSVVQQVHGFFHITNLEFYRSPPVMHWARTLVGNTSFSRMFDDQIAVTAPAAVLAPERSWDMESNGLLMNVFHNYVMDGKRKRRVGGFKKKFWKTMGNESFPEAYGKCKISIGG